MGAIQAGQAFHTLFIAASGNSELLRVTLDRRALIARFILLRGRATVSESGLREHRAMLDAFTRGDTADVLVRLDRLSAKLVGLAEALTERDIPTARGSSIWSAMQVSRVLARTNV